MRNQRKRRFRDELGHAIEEMGQDLERTADQIRRTVARNLRVMGPSVVRASESLASDLWRRADNIDRALRREGKPPSHRPPPAPRRQQRDTLPGYGRR